MIAGTIKKEELTEQAYRNLPLLSSSSLRTFASNKKQFYKEVILGEKRKEETNKSMLFGSGAHCRLLEPENFDHLYKLSNLQSTPGGNMITFVDSLVENRILYSNEQGELTVDSSQIVETAYETSGYSISIDAVLNKFSKKHKVTGESPEDYFKEVLEAKFNGVTIITLQDMHIIDKIVELVKNDDFLGWLFLNDIDHFNELKIEDFVVNDMHFKGMIDKVVPDHEKKALDIYDLKVVFDNQNFKRDYYLKRLGYIPVYLYLEGLKQFVKAGGLGEKYKNYKVRDFYFLTVDSSCFYSPIAYKVTEKQIQEAYTGFIENNRYYMGVSSIIQEIKFAQENNIWTMPEDVYLNKGIRIL